MAETIRIQPVEGATKFIHKESDKATDSGGSKMSMLSPSLPLAFPIADFIASLGVT